MSLTPNEAAEQYQLAHDELMEIAEDYTVSDEESEIALAKAEKLTTEYIDSSMDNIHALNRQYDRFIEMMEEVIADLERTAIERFLIEPLKQRLRTAKKKV